MDDHNLLLALAGIISAFGVKEVWAIIQKKMDIGAKKDEREDDVYTKQIEVLTNKITQLETKIGDILPSSGTCLLYTSPSPRDRTRSRMPSSA